VKFFPIRYIFPIICDVWITLVHILILHAEFIRRYDYFMITEIVVYGRGGQGAVTGAQIIGEAAYLSKNYKDITSFPSFGAERRGAPVNAFTRISKDETIWTRSQIYKPQIVFVLDETVLTKLIADSIQPNGYLVVNSAKEPEEFIKQFSIAKKITVITTDVTKICIENKIFVDGLPVFNTPILGALPKIFDDISLAIVKKAIENHIGGGKKGEMNSSAAETAAKILKIKRSE
jgi:pyruvate ferredoxin oxidoreductase gamma subunit